MAFAVASAGCDNVTNVDEETLQASTAIEAEARKPRPSTPPPTGCQVGVQSTGAKFQICFPDPGEGQPSWNGDLILYAHGYQAVGPDNPSLPSEGTQIAALVLPEGFAFAATSYSVAGLAVKQGVNDVADLTRNFTSYVESAFMSSVSRPNDVVLTGPSEGGLVTVLAVEQYPDASGVPRPRQLFDGGLAACGPYGNFRSQISYLGDVLVVFNYYFPHVFSPNGNLLVEPTGVHPSVIENWPSYAHAIAAAIEGDPTSAARLKAVTGLAVQADTPAAIAESALQALWYAVHATNDAVQKLGGHPYDNEGRTYSGTTEDGALNDGVRRYSADERALTEMSTYYETSGSLRIPLSTIHASLDPVTPLWHQDLYRQKVGGGFFSQLDTETYSQYGHCTFTDEQLKNAFRDLMYRVKGGFFAFL